jgi:integrase
MARPKRRRGARGLGSVFQRESGIWVAELNLGRDPATGKRLRRTFYGPTQAAAIAKRNKFVADLDEGLVNAARPARRYTVGQWLDYWLEHIIKPGREPTTYELYEMILRIHIKPYLGRLSLKALEVEQVEAWRDELARRGVGLRTRQMALTRLRTALNVALLRRQQTGLRFNAAALVEMPRSHGSITKKARLDDARRLIDAARGQRLEAFITVGLSLGLRRGEIAGLYWEDVDLDARTITIRRRVSRIGHRATGLAKGALIVREGTKMHPDAPPDTVAIPDVMLRALKQHRQRQIEERLHAGNQWKGPEPTQDGRPAGIVFTSEVGTVLEPRNVFRWFEGVRERAGLDDKTFHQLRHDCASLLLAQGVPIYAVSQILRHSSPAITARFYAHLTPELQRDAATRMDQLLGPLISSESV